MHSGNNPLDAWGRDIPLGAEIVAATWWRLIGDGAPWRAMPLDDCYGCVRAVLRELLNEALDPLEAERLTRLRAAARDHGTFRRRQQCGRDAINRELDVLALAIEESLQMNGVSASFVTNVLIVLEPDLKLVRDEALTGWFAFGGMRRDKHFPQ